jgi:spore coat polysaccharide biosynthesis predicted glycosyltransferase SpsG
MNKHEVKRKIILRADANACIGFGHLSRMLAMASFLHPHFELFLVTDCNSDNLLSEFKAFDVNLIPIETSSLYNHPDLVGTNELSWDLPEEIVKQAKIVVLDGYWFGANYRQKCQECSLKTVVIDDFVKPISHANLIINHAPGIDEGSYIVSPDCKVATGLSFALLRPEFFRIRSTEQAAQNGFVCFGGLDSLMLSAKAASFLLKNKSLEKVFVLISSMTNRYVLDALHELSRTSHDRLEIVQNLKAGDISNLLDQSKYAIVPASTVLFEAFYRGCHCLCGLTAENQSIIYRGFTQLAYAFGLGDLRGTSAFSDEEALWEKVMNYRFSQITKTSNQSEAFLTLFNQL